MNKAVAVRSGNKTFLQNYVPKKELQVGTYKVVPAGPGTPTHLEDFTEFSLPTKIYGEELGYLTNKIIKSFNTYKKSVGVLLSGLKGTGKSLQLKHIAMNSKMPVLIVDEYIHGSELISFLEKIPSSSVLLFDEFEKVYRQQEDQESILPLLDGLSSTPHIFVLTVNDSVSNFLLGRPSRIRYNKKYYGLEENFIKEIAQDLLINKSKLDDVTLFLSMMQDVNMDMVVSFIQDVNLYPEESVEKIIKTFNLDDPMDGDFRVVFGTPGLVVTNSDKSETIKAKVLDFMETKYGHRWLHIKEQMYDINLLKRNKAIMEDVVNTFQGEVAIKMITGASDCTQLDEFLNRISVDGDIYMSKNYGTDEFIPPDCVFEQITGDYYRPFGPVTIKKMKNGDIEIYSTTQLIAVASKQRKFHTRF
jgi:hypothetical protein